MTAIDRGAGVAVKLPFAYLPLGDGYIQVWFFLSIIGFLLYRAYWRRKPKALAAVVTASVLLLAVPLAADNFLTAHSIAVTAVRAEDESGVLIQAGGVNVVFGCTDYSAGTALRRELMAKGVKQIDLYVQPDGVRKSGQITEDFADIFEVKYLALNNEAFDTQSYPYGMKDEQLLSTEGAELSYPNGTVVRVYGKEDPVLEVFYQGEYYMAVLDLKDALSCLEEKTARLVTAAGSTTDRNDIPAEQIMLLTPREEAESQSETIIPAYEAVRTTLLYPDWGGVFKQMK